MYEIIDYQNKSERVRRLMLLDDVEENAALYAHQIADDFGDAHFCNRTRVVLEGLAEEVCERGITLDDSLKGEIQGIYNHQVKLALWGAGFKDIRDVVQGGEHWIEFYKY